MLPHHLRHADQQLESHGLPDQARHECKGCEDAGPGSLQNIKGQAITVAECPAGKPKEVKDFMGFVIGVPFPFSMHNLLQGYYLGNGGINPDTDVQIHPVTPPDMIAQMVMGD